jgi:hypothetical protein
LHYEFAQDELEVWYDSFCDYLSVSQNTPNSYRHLETQVYLHENPLHLVILRENPKPASRTEIDACSCRAGSGEKVYRKMVMVNMVFAGLGLAGLGWHGPAAGHSIPCLPWMI